jgi:hypothetical protein
MLFFYTIIMIEVQKLTIQMVTSSIKSVFIKITTDLILFMSIKILVYVTNDNLQIYHGNFTVR